MVKSLVASCPVPLGQWWQARLAEREVEVQGSLGDTVSACISLPFTPFPILQVIYMGVALYAPSLALNAGEESQSLTSGLDRLEKCL